SMANSPLPGRRARGRAGHRHACGQLPGRWTERRVESARPGRRQEISYGAGSGRVLVDVHTHTPTHREAVPEAERQPNSQWRPDRVVDAAVSWADFMEAMR